MSRNANSNSKTSQYTKLNQLSTDENNNYTENSTSMKQGKTRFRHWEISLHCNHSFREEYERRVLFRI